MVTRLEKKLVKENVYSFKFHFHLFKIYNIVYICVCVAAKGNYRRDYKERRNRPMRVAARSGEEWEIKRKLRVTSWRLFARRSFIYFLDFVIFQL